MSDAPRLTSLAHGGGCGCKLAPAVLREILAGMPTAAAFPDLLVGTETSDDAAVWRLNAEQALLNSRVTLVQNLSNLVTASYSLAAAIGRLTARDLNLNVPLYDETAYYNAVRQRLAGTGDYATAQPGR